MIKKKKVDDSNKYFMQLQKSYTYEGFKQELIGKNKQFTEIPYSRFIDTIRQILKGRNVWGSGTGCDM